MFASLTVLCLTVLVQPVAGPIQERESDAPRIWTVTLSAVIDGSGVFTFSEDSVTYAHKHWESPQYVMFNGKPWNDLNQSPAEWTRQRGNLDLPHAWIVRRDGRDVIAMEKTATGFNIYVSDSPNGGDSYSITIAIPLRAQRGRLGEQAKTRGETPAASSKPTMPCVAEPRPRFLAGSVLVMTFESDTFMSHDDKAYVADLSGFGNHGIVEGAKLVPGGQSGSALQFEGKASVILPTLATQLTQSLEQLSVSCWVAPSDLKRDAMMLDVGFFANASITLMRTNDRFRFSLGGNGCDSEVIQPKGWYHVVGVWNGTAQKIYVNGRLGGTVPNERLVLDTSSIAAGHGARLGTQAKSASREGRYFQGLIDEVAIFNRALSEDDVQMLFRIGSRNEPLAKTAPIRPGR